MARVSIGDIELGYEQIGTGTDLILIHGLGNSLQVWDAHVEAFAAHHRVLRFDVRGFGQSDKPSGPYSLAGLSRDVANLMDSLGLASAHVLGISMGGVIAQRFGLDFPDRARSLVLVSTSSEVGPQSAAAWQRLADSIERRGFDPRSADASRAFAPGFVERHPEVVREFGQRNAENDPRAYAAAARAVSDYQMTEALRQLEPPALILQGLADRMTPPGGSVKMSRAIPRCRLMMVEDAGHNLPIEKPEWFTASVLGFLGGVDLTRAKPRTVRMPDGTSSDIG